MKSCVCVILAAFLFGANALTEEQLKKANEFATTCQESSDGVTKEAVANLRSGDFSGVDKNSKCFVKCFLEKAGFMDSQGNLVNDYAIERLSLDRERSKVEALVKQCSVKTNDPCETAFKAFECYYNGKASLL
ncbi:general odorant-binding protein 56d-like [Toxorhynchites rutilus septentrionalis]|uniref:general odorant-binding protein 56d-like n=1 Tax=Toxorhynchites rutilus septentrionalis TaxID=329112 RepID=UPI002479D0B5|nr:general odorant-binding protein 56d-like [Toxorhynchites rutilus septentrionalis]